MKLQTLSLLASLVGVTTANFTIGVDYNVDSCTGHAPWNCLRNHAYYIRHNKFDNTNSTNICNAPIAPNVRVNDPPNRPSDDGEKDEDEYVPHNPADDDVNALAFPPSQYTINNARGNFCQFSLQFCPGNLWMSTLGVGCGMASTRRKRNYVSSDKDPRPGIHYATLLDMNEYNDVVGQCYYESRHGPRNCTTDEDGSTIARRDEIVCYTDRC
ncbi:hypothetical protein FQN54_002405 [Arachnomyces sp. PD_36]|nr:hypothetical protein FQN54_002405 [Arachnomyces sp. PD_36]